MTAALRVGATMVRAGDDVGDWSVLRIDPRRIWLRCKHCETCSVRAGASEFATPCHRCGRTNWRRGMRQSRSMHDAAQLERYNVPAIDPDLPFDQDRAAAELVAARGALSIYEVGASLGLSGARVLQLEQAALRKLAQSLSRNEVLAWLSEARAVHPLERAGDFAEASS